MTDRHPLTDDIIDTLASPQYDDFGGDIGGVNTGFNYDDLRAAADWQLEQCIAWLDDTDCDDPQETAQRLREAMRPTTTQEGDND